jgi:short-subunit dehydrogenase
MAKNDKGSRGTALVTGASSGIGLELARILGANHFDLVVTARSEDRLRALAAEITAASGASVRVVASDLAHPEGPEAVARAVPDGVDVLVNDAGFATHGPFAETPLAAELDEIQVNVVALTHLTKLLLPAMRARGSGKILNVASTAAFVPGPFMAVYYATKAYVLSFSVALAEELAGTGVSVTVLCPGATRTGFEGRAGVEGTRLFRSGHVMGAREVAEAGYAGLMAGRTVVVPGVLNRLVASSSALAPRRVLAKIARALNEGDGQPIARG